jgi:hypothetical protein
MTLPVHEGMYLERFLKKCEAVFGEETRKQKKLGPFFGSIEMRLALA